VNEYRRRFHALINDDLSFPQVIPLIWEMAKTDLQPAAKAALLLDWDGVLGLRLADALIDSAAELSSAEQALLAARAAARVAKDFAASDRLREELAAHGIVVNDGKEGQSWTKEKR